MDITINTVIIAAQEIIYRNRQIDCTLALKQVRRKLYNQMIEESFLAKFSIDKQNFNREWFYNEDDLYSYRLPTD